MHEIYSYFEGPNIVQSLVPAASLTFWWICDTDVSRAHLHWNLTDIVLGLSCQTLRILTNPVRHFVVTNSCASAQHFRPVRLCTYKKGYYIKSISAMIVARPLIGTCCVHISKYSINFEWATSVSWIVKETLPIGTEIHRVCKYYT